MFTPVAASPGVTAIATTWKCECMEVREGRGRGRGGGCRGSICFPVCMSAVRGGGGGFCVFLCVAVTIATTCMHVCVSVCVCKCVCVCVCPDRWRPLEGVCLYVFRGLEGRRRVLCICLYVCV
jgi:hypothetical protein